MKLLIIEDEYRLADMLNDWFVKKGDSVSICTNGLEGFGKAVSDSFDVIILDIMLPGMDGFSILSRLRKKGINTPDLILSARSGLDDKLKGFGTGAEDYLTKPFHIEELDARVSVLARKVHDALSKKEVLENTGEKISTGDLELDKNSHILRNINSGLTVELPSKEYILMEYFLMNANHLLSKEQITVHIWGYDTEVSYNNEEVYISFLRKKLRYLDTEIAIETIRGCGYRLKV